MKSFYNMKFKTEDYDKYPRALGLLISPVRGKRDFVLAILEVILESFNASPQSKKELEHVIWAFKQTFICNSEARQIPKMSVAATIPWEENEPESIAAPVSKKSPRKPKPVPTSESTQATAPEPAPIRMPDPEPEAKEEKIVFDTDISAPYIAPGEPGYDPKKDPWRIENLMVLDDEE